MPKTGYPDIEISQKGYHIFGNEIVRCQSKCTFRYFYYTYTGEIKADARHLLLDISVSQESKGYWKIDEWALSDLSETKCYSKK